MLHGVVDPFRFGEREVDGKMQYDAITHIHYIGDWAFAVGLTDTLKPSHTKELVDKLWSNEVKNFLYWSDGQMIKWRLYKNENGKVRAHIDGQPHEA